MAWVYFYRLSYLQPQIDHRQFLMEDEADAIEQFFQSLRFKITIGIALPLLFSSVRSHTFNMYASVICYLPISTAQPPTSAT